jgi:hypothetical protein
LSPWQGERCCLGTVGNFFKSIFFLRTPPRTLYDSTERKSSRSRSYGASSDKLNHDTIFLAPLSSRSVAEYGLKEKKNILKNTDNSSYFFFIPDSLFSFQKYGQ